MHPGDGNPRLPHAVGGAGQTGRMGCDEGLAQRIRELLDDAELARCVALAVDLVWMLPPKR